MLNISVAINVYICMIKPLNYVTIFAKYCKIQRNAKIIFWKELNQCQCLLVFQFSTKLCYHFHSPLCHGWLVCNNIVLSAQTPINMLYCHTLDMGNIKCIFSCHVMDTYSNVFCNKSGKHQFIGHVRDHNRQWTCTLCLCEFSVYYILHKLLSYMASQYWDYMM